MQKNFTRSVEAVSGTLDLDQYADIVNQAMPPADEAKMLDFPFVHYPTDMSMARAYIYSCTSGSDNNLGFNEECFIAGCARFAVENPVPSISTRIGFYGNARDVMQILADAENKFGRPVKVDSKRYTAFNMGLPERKEFKKRSTNFSKG